MQSIKVKDIMIPLAEYATVSQEATLVEAVLALKKAQESYRPGAYKHRAILVFNEKKRIVGKVSQLDVLKGMEPGYKKIGDFDKISHLGFSKSFITSMMRTHDLWQRPLDNICQRASQILVKDIMYTPQEGEYVDENASLDEAIHQLVIGHHQSLLATGAESRVVGVLRLTDVFLKVGEVIMSCELPQK